LGFKSRNRRDAVITRAIERTTKENKMKQTVNVYDFRDAFAKMGRTNFTYDGLGILFEYLENLEDELGEEIEFDPIGLCCEYVEMTRDEIIDDYDLDRSEFIDPDDEDDNQLIFDWLSDRTSVVGETATTILFEQF